MVTAGKGPSLQIEWQFVIRPFSIAKRLEFETDIVHAQILRIGDADDRRVKEDDIESLTLGARVLASRSSQPSSPCRQTAGWWRKLDLLAANEGARQLLGHPGEQAAKFNSPGDFVIKERAKRTRVSG